MTRGADVVAERLDGGRAVPGGLGGGDAVGGEAVAERLGGGGVRN